jgi:Tol biopolymer transport system component
LIVVTIIVGVPLLLGFIVDAGLRSDDSQRSNESPSWSPDGRQILFVRDYCPQGGLFCPDYEDILVMRADGTGLHRLRRIEEPQGLNLGPVWSPDGKRIAFASGAIYTISADGRGLRRLPHSAPDAEPSWSPDGRRIAFTNEANDYRNRIGVMDADGGNQRLLTSATDDDFAPTWSPDGHRIAFITRKTPCVERTPERIFCGRDKYAIEVMNANGGNRHRLAAVAGEPFDLSWAPDGRRIAYADRSNIYVSDADGRRQHAVTSGGGEAPAWSPDGRRIAFTTFRDHAKEAAGDFPVYLDEIYVMNANGSSKRRLTH